MIISYDVYFYSYILPVLIWCTQYIDHDTNDMHFNHISSIFLLECIFDKYWSFIEVFTFFLKIDIKNIIHLSINEFILVVLKKKFLRFKILVRIKCIHHYMILNGFWDYFRNVDLRSFFYIDHSNSSPVLQLANTVTSTNMLLERT